MADRSATLLELAMRVTIAQEKLQETLSALRTEEGEWTAISLTGSEIHETAHAALRGAWTIINRVNDIAQEQLAAAKKVNNDE